LFPILYRESTNARDVAGRSLSTTVSYLPSRIILGSFLLLLVAVLSTSSLLANPFDDTPYHLSFREHPEYLPNKMIQPGGYVDPLTKVAV